jgi:Cu(I)/Ag(I) efflux system membrane fusion protein
MIEIKSALDPIKKVDITGACAINSEYKFRKASDSMAERAM